MPFIDSKRKAVNTEKQIHLAKAIYTVRTVADEKSGDGSIITSVYAEAVFYDLAFSTNKQPKEFDSELPQVPLEYALRGTEWHVGEVTVKTIRSWQCEERNTLAVLRMVAQVHGGDLVLIIQQKQ